MSQLVVLGIGDHYASGQQDEVIRTYALGSCVALILYHPARQLGAMVHVALPASRFQVSTQRANKAGYYADTAVPCLLAALQALSPKQNTPCSNGLQAKLAGGANILANKYYDFEIGDRIVQELHQLLAKAHIPVVATDTGGKLSRTVSLEISTGKVAVSSMGHQPYFL